MIMWLPPATLKAQLPAPSFYHLRRDIDLFSSCYHTIAEDPYGFLWFGSQVGGGLYRYDGYELQTFQPEPERLQESLVGSRINRIYFSPDSMLYVGTYFGFTRMNPVTGELQNFNNILDSLPDSKVGFCYSFLHDTTHDALWIGTRLGLAKMNLSNDVFQMVPVPQDFQPIPLDITQIISDPLQPALLWLGTYQGLFSYHIDRNEFRYYLPKEISNPVIAIFDIFFDKSSVLWITTNTGALLQYHPSNDQWKEFPVLSLPDPDKDIYSVIQVNDEEAWLSTSSSVGRYHLANQQFDSWRHDKSYPDGLMHNGEFRDMTNDRHGRLWIASWHGVQYSKEAVLAKSEVSEKTKVAITAVSAIPLLDDESSPLIYMEPIQLERTQRDITFHYVLPNPLHPGREQYRYRLKGYDNEWITTDQREVRYSKVPGGSYSFQVTARENENDEWLPVTEQVISIDKRVSEMWWFWAGIMIVAGMIAVVIYHYLVSRVRREERLKAEFEHRLSEIQMQALRAQMNPHFLFNSLNSIKYFAITKSKDETAAYLSKFALLVRSILNNSKSKTISLKEELEALKLYIEIEHLRLDGKFDYNIEIENSIHINQAQIPPMILQPYVENAIWHGLMHKEGRGYLLVQVKDLGDQVQCIIEDNGIGRQKAAELRASKTEHKTSVGMQITSDRIALINKIYAIDTKVNVIDLVNESGMATGTRVVIHIPLIRDEEE